jgi:hypothetical protein
MKRSTRFQGKYQDDDEDTIMSLKKEIRDIHAFIRTIEHNKKHYGSDLEDEEYEPEFSDYEEDESSSTEEEEESTEEEEEEEEETDTETDTDEDM